LIAVQAPEITVTEVAAGVSAGSLVAVDVREPAEWDAGHIDGSLWIPLGELVERASELPDVPLAIVCRTGSRSGMAADWLHRNGADAANMTGGLKAWEAAGLPLEPAGGRVV
jgi:rhodanese-related sulfurtransferase